MATNNLRILYANKLTAATGGLTPSNLLNDYKSQTSTSSTFTLTTSSLTGKVAVVAMLAENTASVTMTVNGTAETESTQSTISSTAAVGYGGGKYVVVYLTLAEATTSFAVTFSSAVKVSRFLVGNYWSPTYNTSFGVQVGYEELTTTERLQSGDLYSTPGPRHKTLSFNLEYVTDAEKFKLFDIVKLLGKSKPLFVSVFPEDSDLEREQMYSICGKFTNLPAITYAMFTRYTTSLQLEEI